MIAVRYPSPGLQAAVAAPGLSADPTSAAAADKSRSRRNGGGETGMTAASTLRDGVSVAALVGESRGGTAYSRSMRKALTALAPVASRTWNRMTASRVVGTVGDT